MRARLLLLAVGLEIEVDEQGVSRKAAAGGPPLRPPVVPANGTAHVAVDYGGVPPGVPPAVHAELAEVAAAFAANFTGGAQVGTFEGMSEEPSKMLSQNWHVLQAAGLEVGKGPGAGAYFFLFSSPDIKHTFLVALFVYGLAVGGKTPTGPAELMKTIMGSVGGTFSDLCGEEETKRGKPGCIKFSMKKNVAADGQVVSQGLDGAWGRYTTAGVGVRAQTYISGFAVDWIDSENFFLSRDVSGWTLTKPGMGGMVGLGYWKFWQQMDKYYSPYGGSYPAGTDGSSPENRYTRAPEQDAAEAGLAGLRTKLADENKVGLKGEDTGVPPEPDCSKLKDRKGKQGSPGAYDPKTGQNPGTVSDLDVELCEQLSCGGLDAAACAAKKDQEYAKLKGDPLVQAGIAAVPDQPAAGTCTPDSPQNACNPCSLEGHCGSNDNCGPGNKSPKCYCQKAPDLSNCEIGSDGIGRAKAGGGTKSATLGDAPPAGGDSQNTPSWAKADKEPKALAAAVCLLAALG